jgi:predicted small lipoprotein YifL
MRRLVVFLFAITILTACGLKGPLYLPDKTDRVVVKPANAESSSSSTSSAN